MSMYQEETINFNASNCLGSVTNRVSGSRIKNTYGFVVRFGFVVSLIIPRVYCL